MALNAGRKLNQQPLLCGALHYMQDKKKVPSEDSIYRQACPSLTWINRWHQSTADEMHQNTDDRMQIEAVANGQRSLVWGLCRLLGCDVYSFDFKLNHIARHIQLPSPPHLGPGAKSLPDAEQIPPLLVLNIQLPMYPVRPVSISLFQTVLILLHPL